jgi:hypothetical protein
MWIGHHTWSIQWDVADKVVEELLVYDEFCSTIIIEIATMWMREWVKKGSLTRIERNTNISILISCVAN